MRHGVRNVPALLDFLEGRHVKTIQNSESARFATFEHGAYPIEPLVEFVAAYFNQVLDLAPSAFTLKVTRE